MTQGFPLRLFTAVFVIAILTTVFSGWQSWQLHSNYQTMSANHVALTAAIGRIMLLDEALTMSARMNAATGDVGYEKRYDNFDRQLTREIDEIRAILPRPDLERFVAQTDAANLELVKMERQAFALVHQGKRQEALSLLTSAEYIRLKNVYVDGMERTENAATNFVNKSVRELQVQSLALSIVSFVGTLLLMVTWFFAIRSAHRWATERKVAADTLQKAQDQLLRGEKLAVLGQIAGTVGHELRNPLGVMSNAVYFLQTVLLEADDTTREYLQLIKDEIAGCERIVSDLLDAVRTKEPRPKSVQVRDLIESTLHKCTVPPSVRVKLDIPATLPPLRVDTMQLHQVFRNLISNGVEAMPGGGILEVRAVENHQDGTITVSVRDSGDGITPEVMENLFQPLFTTKARGIGLGLVVVKNLTQANGGSVEVQSEIGKGSVFIVTLPGDKECSGKAVAVPREAGAGHDNVDSRG